ncbi:MAG: hypothetical protein HYV45_02390 [Candidatus Moranbacteria bacterium]|nr:hypothetical protein [Candidatus Moranbacteria bacterium]
MNIFVILFAFLALFLAPEKADAGVTWKQVAQVCKENGIKNCNRIYPGEVIDVNLKKMTVQKGDTLRTVVLRAQNGNVSAKPTTPRKSAIAGGSGEFRWTKVGGAPLKTCAPKKSRAHIAHQAMQALHLSDEEVTEVRLLIATHSYEWATLSQGDKIPAVTFCGKNGKSVVVRKNVVAAWPKGETVRATVYTLKNGRKIGWVPHCGNWIELSKSVSQEAPKESEKPKDQPVPTPAQEVVSEAEPEETEVLPVHAVEGDVIPCELQAGAGVYTNRIYRGRWAYGEGICHVFKHGEWQHGPGFYAMGGAGESLMSSYRNKEYGIGLQYGFQRNFINERGFKSTFEVKGRWLLDRMKGHNSEGYWVNQKGQKIGLYGSYYERHGDDLLGVVAEYWKGVNQSAKSSWSGQEIQDRGSIGVYGVYEHKLTDDDAWRLRWIAGVQHTNWDKQNWFRLIPEFRYKEWLMFGPQLAVPIGVSRANQPLSHGDLNLTTIGAFVRVELGTEIRKQDADAREAQVEFIPAHYEATAPPE